MGLRIKEIIEINLGEVKITFHLEYNYKSLLVRLLLIICVIGIMFFPINNNLVKNSNVTNINEESESYKIKAALNDPPNKGYFKYYP